MNSARVPACFFCFLNSKFLLFKIIYIFLIKIIIVLIFKKKKKYKETEKHGF